VCLVVKTLQAIAAASGDTLFPHSVQQFIPVATTTDSVLGEFSCDQDRLASILDRQQQMSDRNKRNKDQRQAKKKAALFEKAAQRKRMKMQSK